jgi:GTPase SAR1 family protein
MLHSYKNTQKRYFVEFWDIGGSVAFAKSRNIFYSKVNGVILVHDLSNAKSYKNLSHWLREIAESIDEKCIYTWGESLNSSEQLLELQYNNSEECLPVLIVGTKLDLCSFQQRKNDQTKGQINVSTQEKNFHIEEHPTLCNFLDQVIYYKYYKSQQFSTQRSRHYSSYIDTFGLSVAFPTNSKNAEDTNAYNNKLTQKNQRLNSESGFGRKRETHQFLSSNQNNEVISFQDL